MTVYWIYTIPVMALKFFAHTKKQI